MVLLLTFVFLTQVGQADSCIPAYPVSFYAAAGQDTGAEVNNQTLIPYDTTENMRVHFDAASSIAEYNYFIYPVELGTATFVDISNGFAGGGMEPVGLMMER